MDKRKSSVFNFSSGFRKDSTAIKVFESFQDAEEIISNLESDILMFSKVGYVLADGIYCCEKPIPTKVATRSSISKPTLIKLFKDLAEKNILIKVQHKTYRFNENALENI